MEHGHAWGVVTMDANFSTALYDRIFDSLLATPPDNADEAEVFGDNKDKDEKDAKEDVFAAKVDRALFDASSVRVRMDVTNQHIAFTLQMKFVEAFDGFMKQMVSEKNCQSFAL